MTDDQDLLSSSRRHFLGQAGLALAGMTFSPALARLAAGGLVESLPVHRSLN